MSDTHAGDNQGEDAMPIPLGAKLVLPLLRELMVRGEQTAENTPTGTTIHVRLPEAPPPVPRDFDNLSWCFGTFWDRAPKLSPVIWAAFVAPPCGFVIYVVGRILLHHFG